MEIGTDIPKITLTYKIVTTVLAGFFYAGILFLSDQYYEEPTNSAMGLLIQGLLFGLFFGFGFPLLIKKYGKKTIAAVGTYIHIDLSAGELIEAEGPANLFRGMESVGGKLFLTNQKMVFKAHKLNIQSGETIIEYADITDCILRKTLRFVDNGVRIATKTGEAFDFVLNDRKQWVEHVQERMRLHSQKT